MTIDNCIRGSLFAQDFLADSIGELPEWDGLDAEALDETESRLRAIFEAFPHEGTPNESETEDDLIWKVLYCLEWTAHLRQQNLSGAGRTDVPDGLLFIDDAAKSRAVGIAEERARYAIGAVLVESKRWCRPLGKTADRNVAPSTQMLRYLRRADDLTEGRLRWGILTNGAHWRLYYQGAGSVSEGFLEVDLATILDVPGHNDGLFALSSDERRHCLKLFVLLFGRKAFLPERMGRTLHQRALAESRLFEERVAANISNLVFEEIFPSLVRAIAAEAASAPLSEVRDAALVLLYRLLFLLYAEDRALLPVSDPRYDNIGLRRRVRQDVGRRKGQGETFSTTATGYYAALDDLSRVIDRGDPAFGLPPYNGGLFDASRTPLLGRIRLSNRVMADVIDALSFEQSRDERRYINYRNLSVQQLGSIYERLLEFETVREDGDVVVRPNVFARKGSGSYYTPEPLVLLILQETVGPLADAKLEVFRARVSELDGPPEEASLEELAQVDPAQGLLELKVCDPAMGSGHFLVSLVDFLSDRAIKALDEANDVEGYVSPVAERIEGIRNTILENAEQNGWSVDSAQLDDEHIVRRMVLKRCIYGVDKNPMAVELAKVSLWLHTFTVGAPLSFLDHHLRCGDSLFGSWVREGLQRAEKQGGELFLFDPLARAKAAASPMHLIETLSDAELAETAQSAKLFDEIDTSTAPLDAFLSLLHAFDWLKLGKQEKLAIGNWLIGEYGDPVEIAMGQEAVASGMSKADIFAIFVRLLAQARKLVEEERFLNWQVAFPGVWSDWESADRPGGFDAVIGNPPWDRVKLQQVEWFASRRREIAMAQRAADRKRMIQEMEDAGDPLFADYQQASDRASAAARIARQCGDYPYLSKGDVNLYSLFVERAMALVHSEGVVGLLTPIGIATDKTSSTFFSDRVGAESVRAFYAFENRRGWLFPDIHHEEQPSVTVLSRRSYASKYLDICARISSWEEFADVDRRFPISARSLASINPNTGTTPLFRTRRDADLTTAIYERLPVLVDRSSGEEVKTWPVRYERMFDMTNDSGLFRTREELEEREGAWSIGGNRFDSPSGDWVPLYEGKMVQIYNHRYADVQVNPANVSAQGVARKLPILALADPASTPTPRFWVNVDHLPSSRPIWRIGFNDVCNTNNARTFVAAAVAGNIGCANTLPTITMDREVRWKPALLLANFCSLICDYIARRKVQSRHLNWYIVEQLPVVPPMAYQDTRFGPKTAAEIVREAVLELTYTSHDMAPFACDLGYVDGDGEARPPFPWNEDRRLYLRAKLDAVFFHLYGVTDRDDIRYIYDTFPIVERQETAAYGAYRSRDLCLAWMNALAAGRPDAHVDG